MEALTSLIHGLTIACQPMNLLYALVGVLLGTAVGVLPGIGPALTVALLLPITFKLDPAGSLIMFAGIYYGGMYGGSTTSILINTPGESASMVTALEGNKMAKAGRAGPALATAAIGSFVAGTIATLGIVFLAPWLVNVAVNFGPEDYFALMCLAFVTVSATFGDSPIRGLTSLLIGLTLGLVGIDKLTGQPRLSFGVPDLLDGVEVTTLAVGLFAVGEALYVASRRHLVEEKLEPVRGSLWMTAADWKRSWKPWIRGTLFGFPIGALPAGGAEIPTFLSYSTERRLAKHPEEFGKGAIEGVAGPEAANNASAAGTLVPLLTLGLPTSATAAMLLAGFQQYGLNPGPLLFAEKPDLVWGLIASLFIANGMLLVLNLPLVGLWVRLLAIPTPWLYAGILVFATMGTIAAKPSVIELSMLAGFGVMGFLMRRFDYPVAPVVVGLILGPVAESQLRRALQISQGDPMVFLQHPGSAVMIGLAAASIWSWTIIIDKAVRFTALNRQADDFEKAVQSGRSLEEVSAQAGPEPDHALPRMLAIALSDWREARQRGALNDHQGELLLVRIDKAMNSLIARESQRIENGLGVLSVVATASPFIGLFGTVWGIMEALKGISAAGSASLETVAGPIGSALIATHLPVLAARQPAELWLGDNRA